MRKVSPYLIGIVLIGGLFVGYWTYQRYFKKAETRYLSFVVQRGDLEEAVKVRGTVVAQKDFDLGFSSSGVIEKVFEEEGQDVREGEALMKLETADLELESKRLKAEALRAAARRDSAVAQLAQFAAAREAQSARFDELMRGARPEELSVFEARVTSADAELEASKNGVIDAIKNAHSKADDGVRNKADQFFIDGRGAVPRLRFFVADERLGSMVVDGRRGIETVLTAWSASMTGISTSGDLNTSLAQAKLSTDAVHAFLDMASLALAGARPNEDATQAMIDGWKAVLSAARVGVEGTSFALTTADEKLRLAEANAAVAEKELALLKAGSSEEQLAIQQALVRQADANIASQEAVVKEYEAMILALNAQMQSVKERISKATVTAPIAARVVKTWLERREVFVVGQVAVSLETRGHKIQTDVSELDIGRLALGGGDSVAIVFDALPKRVFSGSVVSVDPKEVVKDGDKYFRTNINIEPHGEEVRTGMSADLSIRISAKQAVLTLPMIAVREKEGLRYVTVKDGDAYVEKQIITGLSDGESVEIVNGLEEGQTAYVAVK